MRTLELLEDFVVEPRRAAACVREEPSWRAGTLGFALGGGSLYLAQALARPAAAFGPGPVTAALVVSAQVAAGFVLAGMLHLLAELGGGRGKAGALYTLLGLSELSWTLALPGMLLARLAGAERSAAAWTLLAALAVLNLSLKARSLKDGYGIGLGKGWLIASVPYLAALLALLTFVSLAVAGLVFSVLRMAA